MGRLLIGAGLLGSTSTPESWPDFFRAHGSLGWDLLLAIPYGTFLFVTVAYAIWLYVRDHTSLLRFGWSFLAVNLAGYLTYHLFPAAPPWYVALHGLGPAKMDVMANPAGCLRFDRLLGTTFFTGMYGRSADVFGAIPSLHVAYPFQAVLYSFWFSRARLFSVAFYLTMCFSAVYLNHHYLLDILSGTAYALIVTLVVDAQFRKKADRSAAITLN